MTASDPPIVFTPADDAVEASQLTAFTRFCANRTGQALDDFGALYDFSVRELEEFWRLFLEWSGLRASGPAEPVCTDSRSTEHGQFFPRLRLSYSDNLLRPPGVDAQRTAVVSRRADGSCERVSWNDLAERVARLALAFDELGVSSGDGVVAIGRNGVEMVVAGLAAGTVGATFSGAGPEMGPAAITTRFGPIAPVLLCAHLGDPGDPQSLEHADRVAQVVGALPSVSVLIALDDAPVPAGLDVDAHRLSDLLAGFGQAELDEQRPFNHPLFVLFSSGTTGPPKCIVHGAGGTLLEHVKEHRLHHDLRSGDRLFFQTSAAWMMWNWQLSALASGSSIVLYDGPVTGPDTLWRIVDEEDVTVFGTSPPYLRLCEELGYEPNRAFEVAHLRAVLSTGSILRGPQYDWVRAHVGNVPVQSISGGTDIIGCFALGNPNLPVRRGELQCRSLGLDVRSVPANDALHGPTVGELVCSNPFPSRPLGFVGDDGSRFHETYFSQHPGMWTHGDLIELTSDGGVRMHGRSDAVLNVQGIRIGPAEIYEALAEVPEISDAMAIEQRTPDASDPTRVVLLVVTTEPGLLDDDLVSRIRREIARRTTPAHVPRLVVEVPALPTTHSGKRSERAARDALDAAEPVNREALANPDSLRAIRDAVARADARKSMIEGSTSTEAQLRAIWEEVLAVAPIGPDESFSDVGGTSLGAVRLLTAIHERMDVDLPLSVLMHAQTTRSMAEIIDSAEDDPMPLVISLRAGRGRPVFFVHALLGDVHELGALAQQLETERPLLAIRAQGLDPRLEPHRTVEEMASAYVREMRSVQPEGPYTLAGYSFGGLVALEMAHQLIVSAAEVEDLILIDTYVHEHCLSPVRRSWLAVTRRFWLAVNGLEDPGGKFPRFVRRLARRPMDPGIEEIALPPLLRYLEAVNTAAYEAYCPRLIAGPALLIRAQKRERRQCEPLLILRHTVVTLAVERVPGGHFDIMNEPYVRAVAERVSARLAGGLPT